MNSDNDAPSRGKNDDSGSGENSSDDGSDEQSENGGGGFSAILGMESDLAGGSYQDGAFIAPALVSDTHPGIGNQLHQVGIFLQFINRRATNVITTLPQNRIV
jgi:hypothetical protein